MARAELHHGARYGQGARRQGLSVPSAQKHGDGADHGLLLVLAQLGEDGQGQDFSGGALGLCGGFGVFFTTLCQQPHGLPMNKSGGELELLNPFANTREDWLTS
jgi:hypothetical protein